MHDIVGLEGLGIPGVMVASDQFVEAAAVQARALGADPARVFVAHPIQDRTDDEVRALADAAYDRIVAALVADTPAPGAG
ncbi:MAG: hypothetical protein FJW77_03750 [Actinobacteria bacterium]|nr:hypothetical protein [Actinomycetota bacterium]